MRGGYWSGRDTAIAIAAALTRKRPRLTASTTCCQPSADRSPTTIALGAAWRSSSFRRMTWLPLAIAERWQRAIDARDNATTESLRWFCGANGSVVIEQRESDDRIYAAAFRVVAGRVVRYQRFSALPDALRAVSLTDDDEVAYARS
jgi:hypothetical protein